MGKSYDAVTAAFADAKKHPTTALLRQIAQEKRMTDLLARLQAATEGSAELDAAVLRAAGWRLEPVVVCSNNPLIGERLSGRWFAGDRHMGWDFVNPPPDTLTPVVGCPTRSLDAITALIEARGWRWGRDALGRAVLYVGNFAPTVCDGPNFILALNYLFVRALETAA